MTLDVVWATNLSGNYNDGENGYLTSPLIDLSSLAAEPSIDLRWWYFLYSEPSYDFASVEVSADGGGTWTPVWGPSAGVPVPYGWQVQDVTLSSAYAVSNFRVRFHFTSLGQQLPGLVCGRCQHPGHDHRRMRADD